MSRLVSFLPKLAVFAVAAVLSGIVASVAVAAVQDRSPVSTAGAAPSYLLTGLVTPSGAGVTPPAEAVTVAFNEQPSGSPSPLPTLSPADLKAASAALLGSQPVKWVNPTGFPRIPPISQFDGGSLAGYNCTLASGAMLARLGFGIVTDGSTLRAHQPNQVGGTTLWDLSNALWSGYGVTLPYGLIHTDKLKQLLAAGYGAVVQGMYSEIPVQLRLQKDFTGGHAIYLDGYYPGDPKSATPAAYYVIDPLGHPSAGYEGAWWPASLVDKFMLALTGGDRVAAMWAFPPGGTPPNIVGPDVVPIPPNSNNPTPSNPPLPSGSPGASPSESASASPSESPSESPSATPAPSGISLPPPPQPAGPTPSIPSGIIAVINGYLGGIELIPAFDYCLTEPRPSGCPTGLPATVNLGLFQLIQPPPGPAVNVLFADTTSPGMVMVGFTVDPAATSDVRFWPAATGASQAHTSSALVTLPLLGQTVTLARLDVLADTDYQFQVVAGSGLSATTSPVGTFHSGPGAAQFDVSLAPVSAPVVNLGLGFSPFLHPVQGAFAGPMISLATLGATACSRQVTIAGHTFCLDSVSEPAPAACTSAQVTYRLAGIDATGVTLRAYPEGGGMALGAVIEVAGPAPSGSVAVGCLTSGLTYTIALEATGDDHGVLASTSVTVP
jgi:hypothetical protein